MCFILLRAIEVLSPDYRIFSASRAIMAHFMVFTFSADVVLAKVAESSF